MTTPTPSSPDPLGSALRQTEAELAEKLEEACVPDTRRLSDESTGELAKLSDTLLAAARAAKDVVSLRQKRHSGETEAIREFVDRDGRTWRVWPVTPSLSRTSKRESTLGEFEHGWLAFETLEEDARKRLPHYPPEWVSMTDVQLQDLLARAVEAPTRRAEPRSPEPRPRPPG